MSVGDQLGLDGNSELLDQARQKWPAWVVADLRLGVVDSFDDLRAWLPTVDREASDDVLLALAMLAAPDGGNDVAAAAALAKCLLPGACRLAGWLSTLPPREVFRDSQPVTVGTARGDLVVMAHRYSQDAGATWQPLDPRVGAPTRVVITNGTIVTAEGSYDADVLVDGERIVLIGADLPGRGVTADETIDASGRYVIPGGIDVHTHMELPFGGTFAKDTFETGTRAAAFGGPGTIRLLLDAGAEVTATDAHGDTPLAWASWHRRPVEVLRLLLFGPHRIHPDSRSLRENLLGSPEIEP